MGTNRVLDSRDYNDKNSVLYRGAIDKSKLFDTRPPKEENTENQTKTDYYNLFGVMVKSILNNSGVETMLVFIKSNVEEDVLAAIADNKTMNMPSQEVMAKTAEIIQGTDDFDYEIAFVVATDGTTSTIIEGVNQYVELDPVYIELQNAGKTTSFDVHTHNPNVKKNPNGTITANDHNPSGTPGGSPTGDYANRSLQEANDDVNQPSWVIGINHIVGGVQNDKPVKIITFYNSGGQIYQMAWDNFQGLINNVTLDIIIKKLQKR